MLFSQAVPCYKKGMRILALLLPFTIWAMSALAANTGSNFGGVGIDGVSLPDGRIRVGQIVAGGPAHLAGIRVGDIITHIDGKPTQGSDFAMMVQRRLRGVSGSPVVLRIRREGVDKTLVFALKRRQLVVAPSRGK